MAAYPPIAVPVDLAGWPRRELFEHYLHHVPCTYALTTEVDVTDLTRALATSERKTYLAQVWALAAVVNRHPEFRLTLLADGDDPDPAERPAVWNVVHPMFTVFNPERETFAAVWAPFDADFGRFHDVAQPLLARFRRSESMFPQADRPPNTFDVSSLPWGSFTGFTLQIKDAWRHLAPIFTIGRHVERGGRVLLPVAIQIHHAAADGFHTARLLNELQELMGDPVWLG